MTQTRRNGSRSAHPAVRLSEGGALPRFPCD